MSVISELVGQSFSDSLHVCVCVVLWQWVCCCVGCRCWNIVRWACFNEHSSAVPCHPFLFLLHTNTQDAYFMQAQSSAPCTVCAQGVVTHYLVFTWLSVWHAPMETRRDYCHTWSEGVLRFGKDHCLSLSPSWLADSWVMGWRVQRCFSWEDTNILIQERSCCIVQAAQFSSLRLHIQ